MIKKATYNRQPGAPVYQVTAVEFGYGTVIIGCHMLRNNETGEQKPALILKDAPAPLPRGCKQELVDFVADRSTPKVALSFKDQDSLDTLILQLIKLKQAAFFGGEE